MIKYDFVDIGANIGIMSKCLLNNRIRLSNTYCVEPNQENYFCLKNNLKDYKNIKYFNFALSTKKEDKKLFIDKNNMGNLSLFCRMDMWIMDKSLYFCAFMDIVLCKLNM